MAHPILDDLAQKREKLLAVIAALPDAELDRRSVEGWSIRETLTHLINAEEDHRSVIAAYARGRGDSVPTSLTLDEHNAKRLAERGPLTRDQILAGLDDQRRQTETLFEQLGEEQLAQRAHHPVIGDTTLRDIFRIIGVHDHIHRREIEKVLKG
ncbi:MAG: DinB family protein [Chloroflexi bacterium]|nr:DinB family protein [Chloroflexota bacterium]